MQPQDAVDLSRDAILLALTTVAPVLIAGLAAGVLVGLLQSMFQVHDQIAGFVPRLVAMAVVLLATLPWMAQRLEDFGRAHFSTPAAGPVAAPRGGATGEEAAAWPGK